MMQSVGQKIQSLESQIRNKEEEDNYNDDDKIEALEKKFKGLVSAVKKEISEIDRNTQQDLSILGANQKALEQSIDQIARQVPKQQK